MFASSATTLLKNRECQSNPNITRAEPDIPAVGFDGIDIDWEYPQNEDEANNFVLLLNETKSSLANYSSTLKKETPPFLLSAAVPAGPDNYSKLKISEMNQHLDFWNLMAYDYAGSWDVDSGHQANLYASTTNANSTPFNTHDAVQYYLKNGVESNKLILGMPLYGRAFTNTSGPGEKFTGVGPGSWQDGVWDYKALPRANSVVHYDSQAVASWSYDESTQTMISYDTPEVTGEKLKYIDKLGLGGAMWWEASGDKSDNTTKTTTVGDKSLVRIASQGLERLEQRLNVLDYPDSVYVNIRDGMD